MQELTKDIQTHTGNEDFDAYCAYTYMDNLLRGGYPIPLGHSKIFHVYSRKHGDLERDYNYFSMLPEFFPRETETSGMSIRIAGWSPFLHRLWDGKIYRHFTA